MNGELPIVMLVDAVIAVTVLEALALALYHRMTGHGVAVHDYALNIASGLCLMLALRSALAGSGALWVAACLLAAGLAHGADIWRRWKK
ncbi:MAG: hypothetical protein V4757_11645 [Pseudomonadota bacterium]